jgi:chromate reductase
MSALNIIALSGSLRAQSTNTALLRAAQAVAPAHVNVTLYDYAAVPLYSDDLDVPESVTALKAAIEAADGVLIATPEYNYSVPGVLKNAIDWASRPAYRSPFRDTPTGVLSAAASFVGGARAQQHLKTILLGMGTPVFPWPELLVGQAHHKFVDGQLTDDPTRAFLTDFMQGFADWVAGR